MTIEYTEEQLAYMERRTTRLDKPMRPLDTNPTKKHPLARPGGVRSTSRQAYKSIQEKLGPKQAELLRIIQSAKRPINDRELVGATGWAVSSVTARRNELVEKGKVVEAFRAVDPKTSKNTIYWKSAA